MTDTPDTGSEAVDRLVRDLSAFMGVEAIAAVASLHPTLRALAAERDALVRVADAAERACRLLASIYARDLAFGSPTYNLAAVEAIGQMRQALDALPPGLGQSDG